MLPFCFLGLPSSLIIKCCCTIVNSVNSLQDEKSFYSHCMCIGYSVDFQAEGQDFESVNFCTVLLSKSYFLFFLFIGR